MAQQPSLTAVLAVAVVLAACPRAAPAQTLSEKIAQVRREHAQQHVARPASSIQTKILQSLLYTDVTFDLQQTPARDVLDYLATLLDVTVIVRYSDDPAGHGIDPSTPITLEVKEVPAVDALELVLEQCSTFEQCTWQLRRSYLEIGTRERLSTAAARVTRLFPIDELLYEAPRFENAPLAGFSWGYPGWVGAYDGYPGGWLPYTYDPYGSHFGGYGGSSGSIAPATGTSGSISGALGAGGAGGAATNSPSAKQQRAEQIIDLIVTTVEPDAWNRNGGTWATIDYMDGMLVVSAPDYIQRQLAGYPRVPRPDRPDRPDMAAEPAGDP